MGGAVRSFFAVGDSTWTVRRRMAVSAMGFCMTMIVTSAAGFYDKEIAKTIIANAFLVLGGLPVAYSLSVVADRHSLRKSGSPTETGG